MVTQEIDQLVISVYHGEWRQHAALFLQVTKRLGHECEKAISIFTKKSRSEEEAPSFNIVPFFTRTA